MPLPPDQTGVDRESLADDVFAIAAVAHRVDDGQVVVVDSRHRTTSRQTLMQIDQCGAAFVEQRELVAKATHQAEQAAAQAVTAVVVTGDPPTTFEFSQHQRTRRRTDAASWAEVRPLDDSALRTFIASRVGGDLGIDSGTRGWGPVLHQLADGLAVRVDDTTEDVERIPTHMSFDTPTGHISAGTIAAMRSTLTGYVAGKPTFVIDHVTRMHDDIAPDWPQPSISIWARVWRELPGWSMRFRPSAPRNQDCCLHWTCR